MADNQNPKIQYLTDEIINALTGDKVLTDWHDTNGQVKKELRTIDGGIYDRNIFGSIFSNTCNCGSVRRPGVRCKYCQSTVLPESEAWKRFARIDLPFYYCNELRFKNLMKFIKKNLPIKFDISTELRELSVSGKRGNNPYSNKLIFDFCQFNYDESKGSIICTDQIDDPDRCSYDGLVMIVSTYFRPKLDRLLTYINRSILVTPVIVRPPLYTRVNGKFDLMNSTVSTIYKDIIYSIQVHYAENYNKIKTPNDKAMFLAVMRNFMTKNVALMSRMLKPSKKNINRTMQSHRVSNSGRCTVIPAPDLKVDEVYVPRHLMYEACREEFIDYLAEFYNWSKQQADYSYRKEANSNPVQTAFDSYIETAGGLGKHVLLNRNPTLYELGIQCCKVKLTNNYTIGIPLLLCEGYNGDFDGDTFSFYSVPDDIVGEMVEKMSPKNLLYYKKDGSYLYKPRHEIMLGLMMACRVRIEGTDLQEFANYDDALQYKKKHRGFKWQTQCIIDSKITTLGREKLSQLFDADLNEILDTKDLTSDIIPALYERFKFLEPDDRTDRIQQIQEFALLIATLSGSTAPKLSELHANIEEKSLKQIREIEEDDNLTDQEKDLKTRLLYDEFLSKMQSKDSDGNPRLNSRVVRAVKESSRSKINQLLDVCVNRLNVGPDQQSRVSETTLLEGMSPKDYEMHCIENRATQDTKATSVPNSGSTTRQLVYLAERISYTDEHDESDKGILLPLNKCEGRTRVDGSVITKNEADSANPDEMVLVRSIVSSDFKYSGMMSRDHLTYLHDWNQGDGVGVSLASSLTENLTQSGLALKHGGAIFRLDPLARIVAPFDCTVEADDLDSMVILKDVKTGEIARYPKSTHFVLNMKKGEYYHKGEIVGVLYTLATPSYKLDSVIKLIGSQRVSSQKKFINNKVLMSECYAYGDGEITYERGAVGITGIRIGDYRYSYSDTSCYFLPEGTFVKKGQRFCTGVVDIHLAIKKLHNYIEVFYIFFKQFTELFPDVAPELIELTYILVVKNRNGKVVKKNVAASIFEEGSVYSQMAFQNTRKTLTNIDYQGIELAPDMISSQILNSLLTND